MIGWQYYLEERDGELVPEVRYSSGDDIYDTYDEYELARETRKEK